MAEFHTRVCELGERLGRNARELPPATADWDDLEKVWGEYLEQVGCLLENAE